LVYIVTDGINKALPFLLLPFLTYYLTTEDYGVVTNFNVLVSVISVFYFAASGIITVMYFKMEKERFKIFTSNLIILNTAVVVVLFITILVIQSLVTEALNLSFREQIYALIICFTSSITYVNMLIWRCEEKALVFGKYQLSQSLLNVGLTVLFVIIMLLGWLGRVYSQVITSVIFGVISFIILYKNGYCNFKISKEFLKQIFVFALPLIPHALALWAKTGADKILLTNLCGLSENGLYSTAITLGTIVSMVLMSFQNAYSPYLYKKLSKIDRGENSVDEKRQIVKLTWLINAFTLMLVIAIYIISIFIILYLYNHTYRGSVKFMPYIMLSQFFYGGYLMFVVYCHYTLKTKILGIITFSLVVVQILMSWALIEWTGAVGAAISSAIASVLTFLCVGGYAMKVYKMPWFYMFKTNS
jgi:O-antigen/teichoic acid export membrane protein